VRTPHASAGNWTQPLHHQPAGERSTSRAVTYNPHAYQVPSSLEQWEVSSNGPRCPFPSPHEGRPNMDPPCPTPTQETSTRRLDVVSSLAKAPAMPPSRSRRPQHTRAEELPHRIRPATPDEGGRSCGARGGAPLGAPTTLAGAAHELGFSQ
jgi:hypothetical protein